jgi:uncharacterized membrane protein YphA (DoxX/SURF4 family)
MSTWKEFCETDSGWVNIMFRLALAITLIPHCYSEWFRAEGLMIIYEEHSGPVPIVTVILSYTVFILETGSILLVAFGVFGKLSAAILCSSICFHFFPYEETFFNLFWNYRIYVLMFPILFYLLIYGSGKFSFDYRWFKPKENP